MNDVRKIDNTYNRNYLRAEYNFASASAEMAARWEQFMEDGDRYHLQYRTANDGKVRPEHATLHGVTLPIDDPFWEQFYPPNGWNCFVKGTPILTSEGWKLIETIKKGDSVIGGSGKNRIVIGTHAKTVEEKLVRIVTKGAITTCTENHRFLTSHGWVEAGRLKPGDILIQVGKNAPLHKIIHAIGNIYAICRKAFVSLVTKRETAASLTVNDKTQRRNKKIGNIGRSKKNIPLKWKSFCRQIGGYDFFGFTHWLSQCTHAFRIFPAGGKTVSNAFSTDFRAKKSRCLFQLFRNLPYQFAVRFCLTLADVSALKCKAVVYVRKIYTRLLSAFGISNPLRSNGITPMPNSNSATFKDSANGAIVDTPMLLKPTITSLLHKVTLFRGVNNIHAFNGFNSFFDFLRKTFFHTQYILVEGKITTNSRETTVFNLSVENDESYIVPIGITHNCRCSVVQVRKAKYPATPHDEAMALGNQATQRDTRQMFRFNPGKEQKTFPDYNPYSISRCRNCDIAKGKLNLAKPFIPDNDMCAACEILQKCVADRAKSQRAIERTHYMHEMEPLLSKKVEKVIEGTRLNVGFTKEGNKHLFADTFGRTHIVTKEDLKDLATYLKNAEYIDDSALTHPRTDNIEHFYYFKVQVNGKWVRLNVAKKAETRKDNGAIRIEYFLYSVNDIVE